MPEAWRPEPARHIWLIGACILALAASVWAGSARVPASLTYALEDSDFLDRDVPILRTFIQMASAIQGRDAPLEAVRRFVDSRSSAGAVKADRSSEEAEMALHAHRLVLEESGGEWVSEVQAARIREILDRLARVTGERADWYSVTILDSLRVNAVSTADGRIYITRGLVTTSGDDEIATVLAHEMHHIRSGHWMNWWVPSVGPALPPPEDGPAVQALVDAGVSQLAGEAVTSYAQEFEADARAVLHASWAGFEPTRMYRTLTRLPQMPVTSHPTVSDRIAGVRKVIGAMLDQAWIQSFHPVRVAQRAIVSEVEKGRAPEPSRSAQGFPGARAVAEACRQVLDKLDTLESRMRTAERRAPTRPENLPRGSGRIVGRPAFVSSSLAAVDVSVDTSRGKASSGSVGVTCGRVWLARVNGAWVPVVAQTASGQVGLDWGTIGDQLSAAGGVSDRGDERAILQVAKKWRDSMVSDFPKHMSVYSRGRIRHAQNPADPGGTLEAIGWAWFLSGERAEMPAWDVCWDLHSETLATVSFSHALIIDDLTVNTGTVRLTMVLEDGEWRVAEVNLC